MIKLLVIAGSGIFLALGFIHSFLTIQDLGAAPRNFKPQSPELLAAMRRAAVALHPNINLWDAWLGFHFSHSVGLLMFGGAFFYLGTCCPSIFAGSRLVQFCSILIPAIYLILSLKFWFVNPAVLTGISMTCFISASILSNV